MKSHPNAQPTLSEVLRAINQSNQETMQMKRAFIEFAQRTTTLTEDIQAYSESFDKRLELLERMYQDGEVAIEAETRLNERLEMHTRIVESINEQLITHNDQDKALFKAFTEMQCKEMSQTASETNHILQDIRRMLKTISGPLFISLLAGIAVYIIAVVIYMIERSTL